MIYMTHPEHGAMHVYLDAEVEANKKNGWVVAPEKVVSRETVILPTLDDPLGLGSLDEEELLAAKYELKYGKPPHHRMSLATIKKALEE